MNKSPRIPPPTCFRCTSALWMRYSDSTLFTAAEAGSRERTQRRLGFCATYLHSTEEEDAGAFRVLRHTHSQHQVLINEQQTGKETHRPNPAWGSAPHQTNTIIPTKPIQTCTILTIQIQLGVRHHGGVVDATLVLLPERDLRRPLVQPDAKAWRAGDRKGRTGQGGCRSAPSTGPGERPPLSRHTLHPLNQLSPVSVCSPCAPTPAFRKQHPPLSSQAASPSSSFSISFLCVMGLRQSSTMMIRLQVRAVEMT